MSFFGFDSSKPREDPKEIDYDEILEEKYKYAANDDLALLESDDDQLNDETFGDSSVDPNAALEFARQAAPASAKSKHAPANSKNYSLREQPNSAARDYYPPTAHQIPAGQFQDRSRMSSNQSASSRHKRVMSLEEVEAQIRANQMNTGAAAPVERDAYFNSRQVPQPARPNALPQRMDQPPAGLPLTHQEKNYIYELFQQKIMPLFVHIDPLAHTLYEKRGEVERKNIEILMAMKSTILQQSEMFPRGVFIIRPEHALQLYQTMVKIFQYADSVLTAPANQKVDPKPVEVNSKIPVQQKKTEPVPEEDSPLESEEPAQSPESLEPEVETEDEPIEQLENEADYLEPVDAQIKVFEDVDFPALGIQDEPKKTPKIGGKALPRQGNQKQRKMEQQEKEKKGNSGSKQQWVRVTENEDAQVVNDLNIPKNERYKGLMRKHEKELIAKIQISQLVTDDPFVDDYYFQMYKMLKENKEPKKNRPQKGKKSKKWLQSANQFVGKSSGAVVSNQMQQQMKRLIESRRTSKPRENNLSLEGALGKITRNTTKNPKQAIQVNTYTVKMDTINRLRSEVEELKHIEKLYDSVLKFDDIERKKSEDDADEEQEELETEKDGIRNDLWRLLTDSLVPLDQPEPIVCALNHRKGLLVINKVLDLLETHQVLGFFSVLFKRLECLNVCNTILGQEMEKVEEFMNSILPCLTHTFAESPFQVVGSLMRTILERHNLIWLASSRVGLVIMTMILSRAEILKHATTPVQPPSEEDLQVWEEIYNFIFMSFQGQFAELFKHNVSPEDEVYIWQFLSAMAVGAAGIDHQRILVTELRENIIQTSKTNHPRALENVNLFLTALGLNIDAAQLAAMS